MLQAFFLCKNLGWGSEFRRFLRLGILGIVFVAGIGILDIGLAAQVLDALFCQEFWMGLSISKNLCLGISAMSFRTRYCDFAKVLEAL